MNQARQTADKNLVHDENNTTTQPTPKASTTTQESDSITNVHFSERAASAYVSGVRKPIAVRIDTGVYKRFKPLSKRLYGSTYKAVETFMIGVIELSEKGVHFSNTEKPINIDKIVIERNLRSRRDLDYVVESGLDLSKCQYCGRHASGKFRYRPTKEVYGLCSRHAQELLSYGPTWMCVKDE